MEPEPTKLQISQMTEKDSKFILSSWSRSYWENRVGPDMEYQAYRAGHACYMNNILKRSNVLVAKFAGIDEVLGYAVRDGQSLHYVYVKQPYRRQHIATALANDCSVYTAYTKIGQKFAESLNMKYNPYPDSKYYG